MALRNGLTIQHYVYGDIDPVAQRVALHRIRTLQSMYPLQLPEAAITGAFSTLPMDITQVSSLHVKRALATATVSQWLVVAGWPCQDLSTAGTSKGLHGDRSGLLFDMVRVLGAFQQLATTPPAYIIEKVLFQSHHNKHMGVVVTREHVRHNKSGITHRDRAQIYHSRELPYQVKPLRSGGQVTLTSRTGEPQVYLWSAGCR
jgi:site-specific DNA-cytosine methylase